MNYDDMPYCLKLMPSGRWAVLNRRYKPLGVTGWLSDIEYDIECARRAQSINITQEDIDALHCAWSKCRVNKYYVALYSSHSNPNRGEQWERDYLAKIALLKQRGLVLP